MAVDAEHTEQRVVLAQRDEQERANAAPFHPFPIQPAGLIGGIFEHACNMEERLAEHQPMEQMAFLRPSRHAFGERPTQICDRREAAVGIRHQMPERGVAQPRCPLQQRVEDWY
jgi:hypothetical protein